MAQKPAGLIYGVDDRPPWSALSLLAIQHIFLMSSTLVLPIVLVSEIGGVQFATGTADLSAPARESLARFSGIVASYPNLKFTVEGHTDSTGSAATNQELSLRRSITVRDYLIGQKIPASSIDAEGLGSERPVADNETADGRAKNRRVEIVISGGLLVVAAN